MADTSLLRQTADKPLFKDLLWSRPENKRFAGKMLIAGGNAHGFGAPGEAYAAAMAAGIGAARVVLPDNVKKLVPSEMHLEIEFLPSVKNGSFSRQSLAELVDNAAWADITLLAGGVGRNSETTTALESFTSKHAGWLAITEDVLDALSSSSEGLVSREHTLLVAALGQLQKLWPHGSAEVVKHSDTMQQFSQKLKDITASHTFSVITQHNEHLLAAAGGQVSITPSLDTVWRVKTAAKAAVWLAQHPHKPFEAITTSLIA